MNKGRLRQAFGKAARFLFNPRLLLCVGVAWILTNGWSYVLFALGNVLEIPWMTAVGGAYLTFLWLPISPEKLVTAAIAMALLRWWFPRDEKTLAVIKAWADGLKEKAKRRKEQRKTASSDKRSDG